MAKRIPKGASRAKPKPAPAPTPAAGPVTSPAPKKGPIAGPALAAGHYPQPPEKMVNSSAKRKFKRGAKIAGLGALAALGTSYGAKKAFEAAGVSTEQLMTKALYEMAGQEKQAEIEGLVNQARSRTYQDAIQQNLARIQQYAPDLYLSVASGRRLPTGAVVLGGAPRQDLLNELGRAMADGQFSR